VAGQTSLLRVTGLTLISNASPLATNPPQFLVPPVLIAPHAVAFPILLVVGVKYMVLSKAKSLPQVQQTLPPQITTPLSHPQTFNLILVSVSTPILV